MTINVEQLLAKVPTGLLINGQWRDAASGETFDVENPATGEVLATLASANSEDAVAAWMPPVPSRTSGRVQPRASVLTFCVVPSSLLPSVKMNSLR